MKDTSLRKSGRLNLLKALSSLLHKRAFIGVVLLMSVLMALIPFGEAAHSGPSLQLGNVNGFFCEYSNGTYSFITYSYNSNGTPQSAQDVRVVLDNATTLAPVHEINGTIDGVGLSVMNYTSPHRWFADLEIRGPTGFENTVGYTVDPMNTGLEPILFSFPIYDHGFTYKAGFGLTYYSLNGSVAPSHPYRVLYGQSITTAVKDGATNSTHTGTIAIGNQGGFVYTKVFPDYSGIPTTETVLAGTLQVQKNQSWQNVMDPVSAGVVPLYIHATQSYVDPSMYNSFLGFNILFVAILAMLVEMMSFGLPRSSRSLELVQSKPLSRNDILFSRFAASGIGVAVAELAGLSVFEILTRYFTGTYISPDSFLVVFLVALLTALIFSSIGLLSSISSHNSVIVLALPLGLLFFLYYVYDSLATGIASFAGTLGIRISGAQVTAAQMVNPLFLVTRIKNDLDGTSGNGGQLLTHIYYNLPVPVLVAVLLAWSLGLLVITAVIWRRKD